MLKDIPCPYCHEVGKIRVYEDKFYRVTIRCNCCEKEWKARDEDIDLLIRHNVLTIGGMHENFTRNL